MELKQFIKTALEDITNAVVECQAEFNNGAVIVPRSSLNVYEEEKDYVNIHFNVAVTVSSENLKKGGGHIEVLGFNVGLGKDCTQRAEHVSSISFVVPVQFPATPL